VLARLCALTNIAVFGVGVVTARQVDTLPQATEPAAAPRNIERHA